MRRRYLAKEITCPQCQGYGYEEDEYGLVSNYKEDICSVCKGKGYIVDEIDKITGYRVISIEEMEDM